MTAPTPSPARKALDAITNMVQVFADGFRESGDVRTAEMFEAALGSKPGIPLGEVRKSPDALWMAIRGTVANGRAVWEYASVNPAGFTPEDWPDSTAADSWTEVPAQ
ncbi:hypothetical protein [Mycobacteroides abscessus]|uniref:hypothetical protein n=1 Tax=Mycobacteroides abscessus TaxID=36809 RepID=UPI0005DB69EE|nr:hypothetical protein [Mycobacteroides abscessus]CPR79478.1 Uncharacterised protein [Mycobacteroides abscessus]CPR88595.1 Uncharacterised protein [Mycobacteroides abscessus]CPS43534.1 Uncharacterised protein [Mycobacteroides abscessus]CPV03322.1 Uncharacterised protein [Mycobacteroides abscessus]